MVAENNRSVDDIDMSEAPAQSSFMYVGELVTEEWAYLPLEKRQRDTYVKPDVPYYHVAVKPLSYRIGDGGAEGDGLEHTYVAIKTAQGEITPKNSGREELVQAFTKLGYPRKTLKDLQENPAIGKKFLMKRYNRTYKRGNEEVPGELMNVPFDTRPDEWAPAPGEEVPAYNRKPRARTGSAAPTASGTVSVPVGVTLEKVAAELSGKNIAATEAAVRTFVLDRNDLAQGDVLDAAISSTLLAKLGDKVTVENGIIV